MIKIIMTALQITPMSNKILNFLCFIHTNTAIIRPVRNDIRGNVIETIIRQEKSGSSGSANSGSAMINEMINVNGYVDIHISIGKNFKNCDVFFTVFSIDVTHFLLFLEHYLPTGSLF